MELKSLVASLLGEVGKIAKSDAVVGKVRDAGKAKVVPLSRISIGFGTGTAALDGRRDAAGAGAAAGAAGGSVVVEPKAFVVVSEDGHPHMLALQGKVAVLRHGIEILPQLSAQPAAAALDAAAPKQGK